MVPRRYNAGELALGIGALTMAAGAFAGHALMPDRVADHYGWAHERWYQREIGAFNAGLGFGVIAYAHGRREEAFLGSWSAAAILLAATRLLAIRTGDRRGAWNLATVVEDAALGVGGLMLMRRARESR
jgi:hypothetical protein